MVVDHVINWAQPVGHSLLDRQFLLFIFHWLKHIVELWQQGVKFKCNWEDFAAVDDGVLWEWVTVRIEDIEADGPVWLAFNEFFLSSKVTVYFDGALLIHIYDFKFELLLQ